VQESSKILSNKLENLEDYATSLEEEILQGERDLETMTKKKDVALAKVGSDIKAKDVVISEKNTEIKRLLGVQKEFEAHVVEIETELKSIKENFELYKKELLKDEVITPTLVPPSVIPPVKP
jgi:chromosome segregation ATPase